MNRILFIILFSVIAFSLSAQEQGRYYYCELFETGGGLVSKSVRVNVGYETSMGNGVLFSKVAEEYAQLKLENAVAALNYLAGEGWRVVSAGTKVFGDSSRVLYLLEFDSSKHEKTPLVRAIEEVLSEATDTTGNSPQSEGNPSGD